jgi:hypothetical protein
LQERGLSAKEEDEEKKHVSDKEKVRKGKGSIVEE